jgi:hypothetical protein
LRHKTLSFIAGFLILASLILLGIYLQSRSIGALDKASSSIQQSGTEISAAAVTIKDSGEKVAAFGEKVVGLKKETSDDPRKELANMGLGWDEQVFLNSLDDPKVSKLFIQGGMKLSKGLILNVMLSQTLRPGVAKMLIPGSGVDIYGECFRTGLLKHMNTAYVEGMYPDPIKREMFKALCNPNGEFTKQVKSEYEALAKAGHDREAFEELIKKQKRQQTYEELSKELQTRDISKEIETAGLKRTLNLLTGK